MNTEFRREVRSKRGYRAAYPVKEVDWPPYWRLPVENDMVSFPDDEADIHEVTGVEFDFENNIVIVYVKEAVLDAEVPLEWVEEHMKSWRLPDWQRSS